jgi:RNA polymerase sigma factor (sigma-70 family)
VANLRRRAAFQFCVHSEDGVGHNQAVMEAAGVAARPFLSTGRLLRAHGDDWLVARIRAGDQRAFEAVYDRHHRRLLAFCRHMLGNREEAEDVLQHTFASAYRGLCDSDQEIQLKAWLYAIARNRCVSILRVRREQVALDEVSPTTDGLHWQVQQRADLRELLDDLQDLPDDQRAALVLSELGAHSHDEIAMILEVRKDKVKALVFQARESLAASRRARETPCHEVQEQLATLRGSALRRAPIRRHVDNCSTCSSFQAEVQRQRAAMAVILPAAPSLALKSAVLGPLLGGSGVAAGLGAGAAVGHVAGSAAGAGGGITALGQGLAAKAIATAAVVASVGGGGIAADHLRKHAAPQATPHARPAVKAAPAPAPAATAPRRATTQPAVAAPLPARSTSGGGEPGHGSRATGSDHAVKQRKRRRHKATVAPAAAAPVVLAPAAVGDDDDDDDDRGSRRVHKRKKHQDRDDTVAGGQQTAAAAQPTSGGDDEGRQQAAAVSPEGKGTTEQAVAPARTPAHTQAVTGETEPAATPAPDQQQPSESTERRGRRGAGGRKQSRSERPKDDD